MSYEYLRDQLRHLPNCRVVNHDEFHALLISQRKLVRSDERQARMLGLFEPSTGKRFLIEEERLFEPQYS